MRAFFPVLGAAVFLGVGCGPSGPAGTTGELGNGVFTYRCDSDSDPVCDTTCDAINDVPCSNGSGAGNAMPTRVSLGSRFSVFFTPTENTGSAVVEPVSEEI